MKLFLILIFNAVFIFISCKCNCEGDAPSLSAKNEKLIIFKKDSVLDFISNQTGAVNVQASNTYWEIEPRGNCMDPFSKNCDCPSDYSKTYGYSEYSITDSINFSLLIDVDKAHTSIRYQFNQTSFFEFDSTNVSITINDKFISGLRLKFIPTSINPTCEIYYKESLGLVSVVYANGTRLDLK